MDEFLKFLEVLQQKLCLVVGRFFDSSGKTKANEPAALSVFSQCEAICKWIDKQDPQIIADFDQMIDGYFTGQDIPYPGKVFFRTMKNVEVKQYLLFIAIMEWLRNAINSSAHELRHCSCLGRLHEFCKMHLSEQYFYQLRTPLHKKHSTPHVEAVRQAITDYIIFSIFRHPQLLANASLSNLPLPLVKSEVWPGIIKIIGEPMISPRTVHVPDDDLRVIRSLLFCLKYKCKLSEVPNEINGASEAFVHDRVRKWNPNALDQVLQFLRGLYPEPEVDPTAWNRIRQLFL